MNKFISSEGIWGPPDVIIAEEIPSAPGWKESLSFFICYGTLARVKFTVVRLIIEAGSKRLKVGSELLVSEVEKKSANITQITSGSTIN